MPDPNKLKEIKSAIATADPKARVKLLSDARRPLHEEIVAQHGQILHAAPTVHLLPFAPHKGKENDVKAALREASDWLAKEHDVQAFYLYELVGHRGGGGEGSPQFLLVLICNDNKVLERLKTSPRGKKFQDTLIGLCHGKTARDQGEFGINSMLVGLV